ncbi:hypothetical protein [Pseudomonas sp. MUP55]|uniref:hypothetical protein n=1 Tax=Pseudomonas sp. MUP55 TaxID=3087234 RepID=UPI002A5A49D3|nr:MULTISPECIES: hypothetical protein [unclassified Pseudomonas]WPN90322.1 hypothetical protein SC319_13685 [Pseudomonas sp. MUP56]WPN95847.1 hypothetical protein SC318_13690 [Pseudomonas sp. MUP55]
MERSEAVLIIRTLVESISAQPKQFTINVQATAVGQSISTSGGIGMVVNATGGGPGSSVIGNQVRVGSADIKIAYEAADTAITQQVQGLIDSLSELAKQLESEKPDEGLIHKVISSLKDSWVPPLIIAVVNTVAGLALA